MQYLLSCLKFLSLRGRVEFLDMLAEEPGLILEVEERFRRKLEALSRRAPDLIKKILEEEKDLIARALQRAREEIKARR